LVIQFRKENIEKIQAGGEHAVKDEAELERVIKRESTNF